MRIVAVQTGLEPDSNLGGCITDREFLTKLADRGVEIHLLTENGSSVVRHKNFFVHYWKRITPRKLYYVSNFDVALGLRNLVREIGGVDWIRFNHPVVNGIGTTLAANGHRIWGSYLHCEDYLFWRLVDRWVPRRCDLITCLSDDTRRDVVERCPQADTPRNIVTPIGIDVRRIDAAQPSRARIREILGLSDDDILLLFVGVLIPRKGIKDLVAAWRMLPPNDRVHLLLISQPISPEESMVVEELVRTDARVHHLKRVPYEDIPEYFHASDIFFFPTHREGFGIVVGEAMASRLPVVTTRARGVRTVVAENETALVADVGRPDQLASQLQRLIADADLRRALGEAGRKRVTKLFRWDAIVDFLMSQLESRAN